MQALSNVLPTALSGLGEFATSLGRRLRPVHTYAPAGIRKYDLLQIGEVVVYLLLWQFSESWANSPVNALYAKQIVRWGTHNS